MTYSYTEPSRVQSLMVPLDGCTHADFARYTEIVRANDEVRLLDITPAPELHFFNPQAFPSGRVHFNLLTSAPDSKSIFLHDFEPFRKTFVLIGVAPYREDHDADHYEHALALLRKAYPSCIVHNIVVFDAPTPKLHVPKVYFHETSLTAMETIMCDVARNFLAALDNYANSYVNITLRSPVNISNSHVLTNTINQAQKRLSSNSAYKLGFAASPASATENKPKTQIRHKARQSKLMGNFYLLAGKYPEALIAFTDAIVNLKKCDDYLWLASALEGMSLCCVLHREVGAHYLLLNPAISSTLHLSRSKLLAMHDSLSPTKTSLDGRSLRSSVGSSGTHSPRNSIGSSVSYNTGSPSDLTSLPLPEFVRLVSARVLAYYQMSTNDYENLVPDLVYVEAVLRLVKFMTEVYLNSQPDGPFLKADIVREIDRVFSLQLVDLDTYDQCRIYSSLAVTYADLGMYRKRAFILRSLLVGLLPQLEKDRSRRKRHPRDEKEARTRELAATPLREKNNGTPPLKNESNGSRAVNGLSNGQSHLRTLSNQNASHLRTLSNQNQSHLRTLSNPSHLRTLSNQSHGVSVSGDSLQSLDTAALRDIFEFLFATYGIDRQTERSKDESFKAAQSNWTSLQVQLIKLCLRIAEAIRDIPLNLRLCTLLMTRFTHCLPPDDQSKLKERVSRLVFAARRENIKVDVPYWDPFLVRSVSLINSKNRDELTPFTEIEATKPKVTSAPGEVFNPYDKSVAVTKDTLLIRDEIYHLKVQLQNPFAFEIEIVDLQVVTEGVQVQTLKHLTWPMGSQNLQPSLSPQPGMRPAMLNKVRTVTNQKSLQPPGQGVPVSNNLSPYASYTSFVLAPHSTEKFLVAFKPVQLGKLVIRGFDIAVENCDKMFFHIVNEEEFAGATKVKSLGLESPQMGDKPTHLILGLLNLNLMSNEISSRTSYSTLTLNVVPPQPSLSLTGTLVTNGWIMLLDGENYPFSISLTNHSNDLINYLSFSFWDSTIEPLNKRLSASTGSQMLPALEIYEIEWHLLMFKPFTILNKDETAEKYSQILPRSDIKIDYMISARRGMKELKIILEYANKLEDLSNSFIKEVEVPLNLTVVPSLEVVGCDIVSLFQSSLRGFESEGLSLTHKNLDMVLKFISETNASEAEDISDYCLLILDIRNNWREKLASNFKCNITQQHLFEVNEEIDPGKTLRIMLPIKRVCTTELDLYKPIPSLRNKQFVKNYAVSEKDEMKMREIFWIRNNLLENLRGSWHSVGIETVRRGNIDLRSIRLNSKMSGNLIYNPIRLFSTVVDDSGAQVLIEGGRYILDLEEFYSIRTTIVNSSDSTIKGVLRNVPFPTNQFSSGSPHTFGLLQTSLDKRMLINGLAQNHIGKHGLAAGETMHVDLSFTVLEKGEYEWGSVLEILNKDNMQIVVREPLYIYAK